MTEVCTGRNNLARPGPVTFRPGPFPKNNFPAQPVFNLDVTYHMIRTRIKSSHQSQCLLAYIVINFEIYIADLKATTCI